jgi:acyl-coenzyme A thioesterase PaaI-like protein
MACADSAMAIAISSAYGAFRNITTVSQSISFMRPIAHADVIIGATLRKLGRALIFGDVLLAAAGARSVAAHATATWALIP